MRQIYKGHTAGVNAVEVTPEGKYIVSGSSDKTLRLWDLVTGECLRIFNGHKDEVNTLAMIPDGKSIISGSRDSTLRLWDIFSGKCLKIFQGHDDDVNAVAVTPDGKSMVSGSSDCSLRLWEVHTAKCLREFKQHPACRDMDGLNKLIRSSNYEFAYHDFLSNLAHAVNYDRNSSTFLGHADDVKAVAITKNGKYIISGSDDNTLRLWNLHTGKCLWLFGGHNGGVNSSVMAAAVSPFGKYAISGGYTIQFWKISKKNIRRFLWGIVGEKCHRSFKSHEDGINAMALTPNYKKIIVASSWKNDLKVYKRRSGKCLQTFTGHEKRINDVAVSPDNRFAVSASSDHTLILWDLKSKKQVPST
jgi:WD40 repeat protein